MAHWATHEEHVFGGGTRTVLTKVESLVPEPDDDWEAAHMAWLGLRDRLEIAMGCQDCAEAIYEQLDFCRYREVKP